MEYKLRPYQEKCVETCHNYFKYGKSNDNPIACLPTGSGKSLIIASLAKILGDGVLVINPQKELLEQNYAKYEGYGGVASIYSASMGMKEVGMATFATIGSIVEQAEKFAHVRYIIIDECHLVPPKPNSMFMYFIRNMPNVKVLGLSATPFRLKKYRDPWTGLPMSKINLLPREKPKFFNKFIHVTQISEMYEQGYLARIKYMPIDWDDGKLIVNTTGAEYTDKSIDEALREQKVYERLPDIIQKSIEQGRKYRVVFVNSVADAEQLASVVPDSHCVSAKTPKKERERILNDFKAGKIKTIFNVGVLTIGFDFPALDTVIIARPTMSLALYMQMIGRGIRVHESKQYCAVVDFCGNYKRFGKIENLEYKQDYKGNWVLVNEGKILTGVKMEK